MKPILVLGAGGQCKTVISALKDLGEVPVGVLDQTRSPRETVLDIPIIGERSTFLRYIKSHQFFVAVGNNTIRMEQYHILRLKKAEVATIIHPESQCDPHITIGCGSIVSKGAMICPQSQIGENVIINSRALVEHDCKIDDHAHIGPDASLAGRVHVQEGAFIGLKAAIKDGVNIGKWAIVGTGAVVVSDVPDGATVVGNPARIVSMGHHPKNRKQSSAITESLSTIRETLEKIDYHGSGFAVVIDEDNTCLGILTDGMIRRHVLNNGSLDIPVVEIMNRDFFFLFEHQIHNAIHHFSPIIHFIPILNQDKKLVRVLVQNEILSIAPKGENAESVQLKQLYQWMQDKQNNIYDIDLFIKKLEMSIGTNIHFYHSSSQILLTHLMKTFPVTHWKWSEKALKWWPSLYTTLVDQINDSIQDDIGQIILNSEIDTLDLASNHVIVLCGFNQPISDQYSYLLRCTSEDFLNLEGAGLLLGKYRPVNLDAYLHPMQIASALPHFKKQIFHS